MDLELRLRDALVLDDTRDDFIARVMARVDSSKVIDIRTRRRSRFIGLGTLAVVGVAAAMFAWQMSGSGPTPEQTPEKAGMPQPVMAEGLEVDREAAAIESPSPTDPGTAEPSVTPAAAPLVDATQRFTILVMSPADAYGDASAKPATMAFHAALLQELRRMPDLVLLDSAAAPAANSASVDYTLTVSSLEARRSPPATVQIATTSNAGTGFKTAGTGFQSGFSVVGGGNSIPLPGLGTEYWPVEAKIEEGRPAPTGLQRAGAGATAGRDYTIMSFVGVNGIPSNEGCSYHGSLRRSGSESPGRSCRSTASIAADLAEVIREAMNPAALQQYAAKQLRNAALSVSQRRGALSDLLMSANGSVLDDASMSAIADYISGLAPAERKVEWQKLSNRKELAVVEKMLVALRQDTDESVRLAVLAALVMAHGGEQPVLDAIDAVSRNDPREIVRMAARRVLHGDTEWRSYVKSTLRNASLPYADRLQPLLVPSATASQFGALRDTLRDDEVAGLLVQLVREHMSDASQLEPSRKALALLGNVDRPEVLDLQLEVLRIPFEPGRFTGDQLAVQALSVVMRHRDEPRVRKVLDQIMAGELNPALRSQVESQLTRRGGPPTAGFTQFFRSGEAPGAEGR